MGDWLERLGDRGHGWRCSIQVTAALPDSRQHCQIEGSTSRQQAALRF